jgi:hypothetical protein
MSEDLYTLVPELECPRCGEHWREPARVVIPGFRCVCGLDLCEAEKAWAFLREVSAEGMDAVRERWACREEELAKILARNRKARDENA